MARPRQDGLLYFSLDTDFFYADKRIKRLHAKYGSDGLIFFIYLLTEIYRNGYYASWNEEVAEDVADDLHFKEGFTEQVMKYLVSRSLLTMSTLANSVTIITSPGIQRRYQEAKKGSKRQIEVDQEIWLLSESETATCIKVTQKHGNSGKNQGFSEKNEGNSEKKRIKESKGKESNKDTGVRFTPPSVEEVSEYCSSRNNGISGREFVDHYEAKGWMIGKERMKDWRAAVRTWENRRKGRRPGGKGAFGDFRQNDYDFGQLEEELRSN